MIQLLPGPHNSLIIDLILGMRQLFIRIFIQRMLTIFYLFLQGFIEEMIKLFGITITIGHILLNQVITLPHQFLCRLKTVIGLVLDLNLKLSQTFYGNKFGLFLSLPKQQSSFDLLFMRNCQSMPQFIKGSLLLFMRI